MPMKILRDASTVLAAQTGRLEPQAPAKRERTPSGYNCPKANHRVKEQMMSKLSLKMKLAVGFGTLLIILVVIATVAYTAVGSLAEAAKEVGRKASEKEMLVKIELAVAKGRLEAQVTCFWTEMKHWKLMRRANATTKIALRNSRRWSTRMRARGSFLKSNIRTTICVLSAIKRFSSAGPGKRKMQFRH